MFINEAALRRGTWQAFERAIGRLLLHDGYEGVKLVGQTGDRGADLLAHRAGKRWLFQAKHWKMKVGVDVLDQTLNAMRIYRAQVPVIVALSGFENEVHKHQRELLSRGIPLQLWDLSTLIQRASKLPEVSPNRREPREYQEEAIRTIVHAYNEASSRKAMVVMATGERVIIVMGAVNVMKPRVSGTLNKYILCIA
jgi:predicted helicase